MFFNVVLSKILHFVVEKVAVASSAPIEAATREEALGTFHADAAPAPASAAVPVAVSGSLVRL